MKAKRIVCKIFSIERGVRLGKLLAENDYLPLEPFCSSIYDYESTDDWLLKLKAVKTISAHRFNQEKMAFEEVILVDEEVKKEA